LSIPRNPVKARLIFSVMGINEKVLEEATGLLREHFGPVCTESDLLPFDRTTYYEPEMGKDLVRRFVAFQDLIGQSRLPQIKLWSNELEKQLGSQTGRIINLDPGYISAERLVLATGKNFTHRIYLGSGIYADLTLMFFKKSFRPMEWTYPDYADGSVISFMNQVRSDYMIQLQSEEGNEC
jgi:hypothetical protein